MEPNFHDGEYLVIDQLSYRFREPKRGEVVVFQYPQDHSEFFIKRIIGLPGEEVRIEGGRITIRSSQYPEGIELSEAPYIPSDIRTGGQVDVQLESDEYFVLGDNRPASSDSRSWGAVDRDEIIGRTWVRAWPLSRLGILRLERIGYVTVP